MPIEGKNYINPKMMRKHADVLREHLYNVALIMEKLQSTGWKVSESYGAIYSLNLSKDITKKEAQKELKSLNISMSDVSLEEFEDEE
mgnify:CR=1 FL=1